VKEKLRRANPSQDDKKPKKPKGLFKLLLSNIKKATVSALLSRFLLHYSITLAFSCHLFEIKDNNSLE